MLILVAVAVDIAIDGQLIDIAEDTVSKTNNKVGQLQNRVDELGGEMLDAQQWADEQNKGTNINIEHDWQYVNEGTRAEVKCICEECKKTDPAGRIVQIGQEVEYPGAGTETWVVLGIEDKNENGTNEGLLITTLEPSTEEITIAGPEAYNNGIAIVDAKCKELYGEEARGMTIEDVNNALGFWPEGGMFLDESNYSMRHLPNFDTSLDSLDIWHYFQDYYTNNCNGVYYTPDYPEGTENASALGSVKVDGYTYAVDESYGIGQLKAGTLGVPESTSDIAKNLVFGENLDLNYYLASVGVDVYLYYEEVFMGGSVWDAAACFGVGYVSYRFCCFRRPWHRFAR